MWSGGSRSSVNFGHSEMGMVGLRDVFLVAPASSPYHNDVVMPDPHNATIHGVGVIPLLTAAPCLDGDTTNMLNLSTPNRSRNSGGIQLWQDHYLKKQGLPEPNGTTSSGNLAHTGAGGLSGSALSSGGTTCQDCGNQAKKDCSHRRCRTCCKSRGFDCPTHVKSTWVPAARRRERQIMAATTSGGGGGGVFNGATSVSKKPRLVASQTTTTSRTSTSNTTPPRSFDTSSSHQDASFKESLPGQVRAQAVFKCVRVTAVDEGDDEYAYQAVVKIGGHVFKGFLYDQGVENGEPYPNISELHLGGGGSGGGAGRNGATSSSSLLDPSDVYAAASGGAFLAGSTYGNAIN